MLHKEDTSVDEPYLMCGHRNNSYTGEQLLNLIHICPLNKTLEGDHSYKSYCYVVCFMLYKVIATFTPFKK